MLCISAYVLYDVSGKVSHALFYFFFLSSSIRVAVRADLQAYKAHVSLDRMKVLLILVSSQEGTPNDFSLLGR